MIGSQVGVYNGKVFNTVEIKVRHLPLPNRPHLMYTYAQVCHHHGVDISATMLSASTSMLSKEEKQVADVCVFCRFAAGDDWPLPRRVLHHIQACLARSRRYRRHQILAVRPAQVIAAPRHKKNNTEKRAGRLREGKRSVREHFRSDGVAVLGSEPHAGGGVPACEWRMSPTAPCFAKVFSPQALHTLSQKNRGILQNANGENPQEHSREYKDAGTFHTRTFRRRATRRED